MYLLLSDFGESDIVDAHIPSGAEILELGCGTGRMTRRLLELGHRVTGVDISQAMLDHVPAEATRVLGSIETLDLGRTFPVVLLASNLINTQDRARRHDLLASCRRHVSPGGRVILQRYAPKFEGWGDDGWTSLGPIESRVVEAERAGAEFTATIEYRAGGRLWSHSFSAVLLDDLALESDARRAGLIWAGTLAEDERWVELRPAGPGETAGTTPPQNRTG